MKRKAITTIMLTLLLIGMVLGTLKMVRAYSGDTIQCSWATNIPTIDGTIEDIEWSDASTTTLSMKHGLGRPIIKIRVYAKNDDLNLYLAFVTPSPRYMMGDTLTLFFDEGLGGGDHDGILTPGAEDCKELKVDELYWDAYYQGDGSWGVDYQVDGTAGAKYHTDHYEWEWQIPLNSGDTEHDINLQPGNTLGICIEYGLLSPADGMSGFYSWPHDTYPYIDATTYGDLVLATDTTPPVTTISLSDVLGDNDWFTSDVTVTLSATDATSGVAEMRLSDNGADWTSWEAYTTSKTYTLPLGDGTKTIYVQFKDNAGLISQSYFDTIVLDTTAPSILITSPSSGYEIKSSTITVTWTGSDDTSGISHYEIKLDDHSWINVGTNTTYTFTGVGDGGHIIEVKAFDKAGLLKQDSVEFIINTSPLLGPGYMEEAAITAITIISALGTAVYLLKIRKKS